MNVKQKSYLLFIFFFATGISAVAQKHDTLASVKVTAKKDLNTATTSVPVQILNRSDLEKRNSVSVADAVKYFSGVTVKDYGGIGGLKTVSIRGLGANQTGVLYDGLVLGDAQGGQTDLGKFSLDNVQQLQLFNAGPEEILSPARAFASASLLSIKTISGTVKANPEKEIAAGIKTGSFGYFSPSVALRTFIGKKFSTGISGSYLQAHGEYPFISYENRSINEKRTNSDVKTYRLEYDAAYRISDSNNITFKTYYYNSKRGLPGAVILFNNISNQRLNDESLFFQGNWQNKLSERSKLLISTKFSKDNTFYLDPAYPNSAGKLENDFHQQEIYLSAAYKYELFPNISAAVSSDFFNSTLKRTDFLAAGFAQPNRNTFLNNVAVQFKKRFTEASANLLYSVINEKVYNGKAGRNLHELTPAVSFSIDPFKTDVIRLRAFYKNIFRAPTFNDLYYTNIGNLNLRPEFADQLNAGITLSSKASGLFNKLIFTIDAYSNNVKDKILAVPRQNLFQWSMQNIGRVKIKGIDAGIYFTSKPVRSFIFSSHISYGYQKATDRSDKNSVLYGSQIPYVPEHSGSMNFNLEYKKVTLSYNILMSSSRFRLGDPVPENIVGGWVTGDLSLSIIIPQRSFAEYKVIAEANNIFNAQYEIIKYYPMPRSNFRIGITASFKKQTNK